MHTGQAAKFTAEIVKLARQAADRGEVPVGAIVVNSAGEIIGRGYNQTHAKRDGLQHAELRALKQAEKKLGDWRLDGCQVYVTLEPCLMCLGAMGNARVKTVGYILADPLFGSIESKMPRGAVAKMFPKMSYQKLPDDGTVAALMKEFFRSLRKR